MAVDTRQNNFTTLKPALAFQTLMLAKELLSDIAAWLYLTSNAYVITVHVYQLAWKFQNTL